MPSSPFASPSHFILFKTLLVWLVSLAVVSYLEQRSRGRAASCWGVWELSEAEYALDIGHKLRPDGMLHNTNLITAYEVCRVHNMVLSILPRLLLAHEDIRKTNLFASRIIKMLSLLMLVVLLGLMHL